LGLKLKELIEYKELGFEALQGKILVIDGTNLLFKYITKIKNGQSILFDYQGNPISHLIGLFYFIINLIERKIKPVFVFDGIPPSEKKPPNNEKITRIIKAWKRYNKMKDNQNKYKCFTDKYFLYKYVIEDLIKFIRKFGLPAFRAPCEGEAQAVRLVKECKAFGIISEDYDSLAFGCPRIFRKIDFKNNTIQYISLKSVLTNLGITYKQLIDIIILMGNDYHPGFEHFGPKTSLKAIKKYGELEVMKKDYDFNGLDIDNLRNMFINPITSNFRIQFQYPNIPVLKEYLIERNFSINRINRGLRRLNKAFKNLNIHQKKIDMFFIKKQN